jgi:hypothetical protein
MQPLSGLLAGACLEEVNATPDLIKADPGKAQFEYIMNCIEQIAASAERKIERGRLGLEPDPGDADFLAKVEEICRGVVNDIRQRYGLEPISPSADVSEELKALAKIQERK